MKQGKLFRNLFLVGMAIMLFVVSSCDLSGKPEDSGKTVKITKVTIKSKEYDVSSSQDITLPNNIDNLVSGSIEKVKGKVEGSGTEVDLKLDKINPTTVPVGEEFTAFTLSTKADNNYKASSIKLRVKKEGNQATTFKVNFAVNPTDAAKIKATVNGTTINSGDPVAKNGTVTFTLENVKQNFTEIRWDAGTASINVNPDKMSATLTVTAETTVTVTLEEKKDVTVTYSVENGSDNLPHGKLAVLKGTNAVPNNTKVKVGDKLTVTATTDQDYVVEEWKINDVKKDGETRKFLTVTVEEAHVASGLKITAKFKKKD